MTVICPKCEASYEVGDRMPPGGLQIKCPKCLHTFQAGRDARRRPPAPMAGGVLAPPPPPDDVLAPPPPFDDVLAPPPPPDVLAPEPLPRDGLLAPPRVSMRGRPVAIPGETGLPPPSSAPPLDLPPELPAADSLAVDLLDEIEEIDEIEGGGGALWLRVPEGKVTGPFDVRTLAARARAGELTGNEETSPDRRSWVPVRALPGVGELIAPPPRRGAPPIQVPHDPPPPPPPAARPPASTLR